MASEGFQKDFIIYNPDRYESVVVTGSWCGWSETGHPLTKIPGLYWIATVTLPYDQQVQYKYIINGNWQTDPDDKTETDASGNTNNVFQVPAASALKGSLVGGTHDTKNEPIVQEVIQNHAPALSSGTTAAPATSTNTTSSENRDAPAAHNVADAGVAAAAAKAASKAGLGHDEHESRSTDLAGPGASGSGLTHVPTGGAAAEAGIAAAAAQAASKAGLGHDEHERNAGANAAGPAASGLSHVPTGGSAAQAGVAQDAARDPAKHGLGSEGSTVEGTTKVAPGVVQATSGSGNVAGISDSSLNQPGTSTRAPLPASTGDAPLAPESAHHEEGKGLFTVLGGLTAAAVAGATAIAHRVQEGDSPVAAIKGTSSPPKGPAAALSPIASGDATSKISHDLAAVDLQHTKSEVVHGIERLGGVLAGGLAGLGSMIDGQDDAQRTFAQTGGPVASAPQASAATAPAVGDGSLPVHHTVNPVPAGTINNVAAAVGSSATTRESPAVATSAGSAGTSAAPAAASSGSSSSPVPGLAINKSSAGAGTSSSAPKVPGLSINEPASAAAGTATGSSTAAATSSSSAQPTKGKSIADKLKSGVSSSSTKKEETAGGSGIAAPVGKSENTSAAGRAIGEDKPSVQAGQAEPATSGLAATPASTVSKKDTSALGKGQPGAAAPATPKKGGHGAEASSATPASEGYKTAPSTPATPADRKRKSSIFNKIKSAFSPSK